MPAAKTIATLEAELVELKSSYHRDGVDFNEIQQAFNDLTRAKAYLKKISYDANDAKYEEKKWIVDSQEIKDLAAKWNVLRNKEQYIKTKRRQQQEQRGDENRQSDDSNNSDKPAPVGSVESTARVFLILYQLFCVLAKVSPSENAVESLDAQEIDALDSAVSAGLHQKFQQSSRLDHLLPALKKLEELGVINLVEDDGNIQIQCLNNALVLFSLIDAEIRGGARMTRNELFCEICDESENRARVFLTIARDLEFLTATKVKRDWELDCGPSFEELGDFAMPLYDQLIKWRVMNSFNEQEDDPVLLSHIVNDMYRKNRENFVPVLRIFRSLDILDIDQNGISRGPAMSIDNEKWLKGDDQRPQQRTQSSTPVNTSATQQTTSQSNMRQPATTRQQTESAQSLPGQRRQCEFPVELVCASFIQIVNSHLHLHF